MCLYPKYIINKKYVPNKSNNYNPPPLTDKRMQYVPVGCGNCIECRKQKAQSWRVRMHEELKQYKYKYFVTLTFSEEELQKLCEELKQTECNAIAGLAVRRFLERWRKKHKKSLRHWLITELGHNGTERIHLHGILFCLSELNNKELQKMWKYGYTDTGQYCNARSINYIIKYVTKIDKDHKGFQPEIFCSAGIGKSYLDTTGARSIKYKPNETREYYRLPNGVKVNLPIYWRNKLFTEEEREKLWAEKLDKGDIYVMGLKFNLKTIEGCEEYNKVLETQQEYNTKLGYGNDKKEWRKKEYNVTLRKLNANQKLQNARKIT